MFPVISRAEELTGKRYGADHEDDVRFRVVADHVRSSMMLIGDGVTPGNEARGYVLRRLLRRAVRSMRLLGYEDPSLPELMPISRDKMGETYADLVRDWDRISRVAFGEEEAFRKTLQAGTQIFDLAARDVVRRGATRLSGDEAFALHDTYGFPIDLTLEMASEQGLAVDEEGFRGLMTEQRERAKADAEVQEGPARRHRRLPRHPRRPRPDRVAGLRDADETESRRWRCCAVGGRAVPRGTARSASSCSTARRSTPSPAARSPTPARSSSTAGASRCSTSSGRSAAWSCTRSGWWTASSTRAGTCRPASTPSGAWAPGRRTPAPTSCTPRCARCSAPPRSSRAPTTGPATCGSTSAGPPRSRRAGARRRAGRQRGAARRPACRRKYMTLPRPRSGRARAVRRDLRRTKVRVVEIGGPWSRELCGGTHVEHSSQIGTMVLTAEASVGSGNRRIEALTGSKGSPTWPASATWSLS